MFVKLIPRSTLSDKEFKSSVESRNYNFQNHSDQSSRLTLAHQHDSRRTQCSETRTSRRWSPLRPPPCPRPARACSSTRTWASTPSCPTSTVSDSQRMMFIRGIHLSNFLLIFFFEKNALLKLIHIKCIFTFSSFSFFVFRFLQLSLHACYLRKKFNDNQMTFLNN